MGDDPRCLGEFLHLHIDTALTKLPSIKPHRDFSEHQRGSSKYVGIGASLPGLRILESICDLLRKIMRSPCFCVTLRHSLFCGGDADSARSLGGPAPTSEMSAWSRELQLQEMTISTWSMISVCFAPQLQMTGVTCSPSAKVHQCVFPVETTVR